MLNNIKSWSNYNKINEKLEQDSINKVDYYYLEEDVNLSIVREKLNLIENNTYRAFATFSSNIEHFLELDCLKIALVNYPNKRFSKRHIVKELNKVKGLNIDEIEFPWSKKYREFGYAFWKEKVLEFSNIGITIRPMLEFGTSTNEEIEKDISFFKRIGIYTFVSSTGLIPEITTMTKWEEVKNIIPQMFQSKIGGVLTSNDINEYIKNDVDLVATTMEFKVNYK